ncbi:MAG: tetratricopeptide repeat protein [Spirochaetia bacterium]|jgi:tetratricopeptide (TPR) repeat protein
MKRTTLGCVLCALLCAALAPAVSAGDRVSLEKPLVSSDKAALAAAVNGLLDQAAALIARLYPQALAVAPRGSSGEGPEYSLSTIASQENDTLSLVIALTRTADGTKTPTLAWSAPATPDLPLWLARAIFLLWSSFHGYLAEQAGEPPAFVDDLPGSVLSPTMPPMGITVTSSGNLAVALIMSALELDHTYRLVGEPAKSLADKGVQLYAGGVSATPGGSLILKPSMGRELYRVQPNAPEAQRVPTGLELSSIYYWTALPDGSALLVDASNRKAYKAAPGKRRQELPLFPNPSAWPTAYATGPDGTIWVYDPQLRGIRIFTSEGTPLDILLPLADPTKVVAPTSMAVGPDGSFVLFSSSALSRFRPDGRLAWSLASLQGSDQSALPASAPIAVDWSRGLIYLCDLSGRRITKILDRAWSREKGIRNDFEEKVIALRGSNAEIAKLYESAGSTYMAKAFWQKVEDADPGNPEADARLLAIEVDDLKAAAHDLDARARTTLSTIGIETARPLSVQAIQKYELLLSKSPDDEKSRAAMNDLRRLFSDTAQEPQRKNPLSITELRLTNLFPSLMHWYGLHPPGSVTVTNSLAVVVEQVRASLMIPGFMDLPYDSRTADRLAPGERATFDLSPVFSQKVLELQEDMAVQAQVTVTWSAGGTEQSTSRSGPATIYRNTALTWDDTRKISSYITPNETTVSGFAARALSGAGPGERTLRFSRSMMQGIRICDALGAYGVTYVQNLDAPFSKALGKAEIIDTVHFPRITLYNRTGDCSDTTALLCSLLESVGIRTAALTTPGHIFAAFDTDEPAENAPYLQSGGLEVLTKNGKVWIPVETTILSQGFMAAWISASDLLRKYSAAGPFEFIPVSEMRDSFPALPLPLGSLTVAEPAASRVDAAYSTSLSGLTDTLYTARLSSMDAALAALSGRQAVKIRVQQGILHALFGRLPEAETAFRKAIAEDPTMLSPYVNLANVRILVGDGDGAMAAVKQGLSRNADSALLNLLAARIYSNKGDAANTAAYFAKVQKEAPDMAARFGELVPGAGGERPQRAADAGQAPVVIWGADQ